MKTKIKKDHLLSEDVRVQAAIDNELLNNVLDPAAPGSSLAKVHGRLLSSKALAMEVAAVVADLKMILRPKIKETGAVQDEDGSEESIGHSKKVKKGGVTREQAQGLVTPAIADDIDAAKEDSEESWESGLIDNDEEGDADGWESGSVRSASPHQEEDAPSSESADDSDSQGSVDETKSPRKTLYTAKTKLVSAKTPAVKSQFLPSLSVGFIRGDSDSDFSDAEANPAVNVRKNRRGQQARRAYVRSSTYA